MPEKIVKQAIRIGNICFSQLGCDGLTERLFSNNDREPEVTQMSLFI